MWTEFLSAVRKEMKPPVSGYFTQSVNVYLKCYMNGDTMELHCNNKFVAETLNRPDILEIVSRKISAMCGRKVSVSVVDLTDKPAANPKLEKLLDFGRAHSNIINIKE